MDHIQSPENVTHFCSISQNTFHLFYINLDLLLNEQRL